MILPARIYGTLKWLMSILTEHRMILVTLLGLCYPPWPGPIEILPARVYETLKWLMSILRESLQNRSADASSPAPPHPPNSEGIKYYQGILALITYHH